MRVLVRHAIDIATDLAKGAGNGSRAASKMADEVFEAPSVKLNFKRARRSDEWSKIERPSTTDVSLSAQNLNPLGKIGSRTGQIDEGDLVFAPRMGRQLYARVFKLSPDQQTAIVKPFQLGKSAKSTDVSLDPLGLKPLGGRIFADKNGRVFTSKKQLDLDDVSNREDFLYNPSMYALPKDRLSSIEPPKLLTPELSRAIESSKRLIESAVGNSRELLETLSKSPRYHFGKGDTFSLKLNSPFNPNAGTDNCMGCTAALFRTLKEGKLYTADDVARTTLGGSKDMIGSPSPGKFKNQFEALEWFQSAAKVGLDRNAARAIGDRGTSYVGLINPSARKGTTVDHMIFAHRFANGRKLYFDPQKGMAYPHHTINTNGNSLSLIPVKLGL